MTTSLRIPCHTLGCDNPGTAPGTFYWSYDGDTHKTRVTYCQGCGSSMWSDGSFTPDDADTLHRAEQMSEYQARTLAKFEAAPPAPESFDPVRVVRAVAQALADLEDHRRDILDDASVEMDDTYGRAKAEGIGETITAIRAALRAAW